MVEYCNFRPDMVILDAEMAVEDGVKLFDVSRKVLADRVPVIFLTDSQGRPGLPRRLLELEGVAAKPLDHAALIAGVCRLLLLRARHPVGRPRGPGFTPH